MAKVKRISLKLSVFVMLLILGACTGSGPKTTYYALHSADTLASGDTMIDESTLSLAQSKVSIAIKPIVVPEYLQRSNIVSRGSGEQSQHILVSGYNAWAGELKRDINAVVAENLANDLQLNTVWAFPWPQAAQPQYLVQIRLQKFIGPLGGDVQLKGYWLLSDSQTREIKIHKTFSLNVSSKDRGFHSYVTAMNQALNQLSQLMATSIYHQLK